MAAECGVTAGLDRRHDATLHTAEMQAVRLPERVAVAAEDVRNPQRGAHVAASGRWRHLQSQAIGRARRAADRAGRDGGVTGRGVQAAMAEQRLDCQSAFKRDPRSASKRDPGESGLCR